jgi:hypothetical protein
MSKATNRIRHGSESDRPRAMWCAACGVTRGALHAPGCVWEQCPTCGSFGNSCGHLGSLLPDESDAPPEPAALAARPKRAPYELSEPDRHGRPLIPPLRCQ